MLGTWQIDLQNKNIWGQERRTWSQDDLSMKNYRKSTSCGATFLTVNRNLDRHNGQFVGKLSRGIPAEWRFQLPHLAGVDISSLKWPPFDKPCDLGSGYPIDEVMDWRVSSCSFSPWVFSINYISLNVLSWKMKRGLLKKKLIKLSTLTELVDLTLENNKMWH